MKRAILSLVLMFVCAFWGMILLDEILGPTSGLLCALISGIACIVYVLDNPLEKSCSLRSPGEKTSPTPKFDG